MPKAGQSADGSSAKNGEIMPGSKTAPGGSAMKSAGIPANTTDKGGGQFSAPCVTLGRKTPPASKVK